MSGATLLLKTAKKPRKPRKKKRDRGFIFAVLRTREERGLGPLPQKKYFVEIERGENDTARVQGATRAGEGRNAPGPSCPLNESGIVLPEFNFNHILRVSKITACDFVFIL